MNYRIRTAQPEDIETIIAFCGEHAEFEGAEYSPVGKAKRLAASLFSVEPRLFCFVAESMEHELLGYATFMKEFSTWDAGFYLHMDCLFLRPHARNFGIGEQFLKEIARKAIALDCCQIQWQTPASNEKGIKFYYRIGATSREKLRMYVDDKRIRELAC